MKAAAGQRVGVGVCCRFAQEIVGWDKKSDCFTLVSLSSATKESEWRIAYLDYSVGDLGTIRLDTTRINQ